MIGSRVFVHGIGAVSPAGWGTAPLLQAMETAAPWPVKELIQPASPIRLLVRSVPPVSPKPAWLGHARLRRASPISQFAVAAALEAIGGEADSVTDGSLRLGVILCVMSGCVQYSRRFYGEVLRDPATASPLLFPETVFNAPSSHLAALLGSRAIDYTLVGDPGTFLQGLALAADWLEAGLADGCVVVGAEETDWITSHAFRLFSRRTILGEGAGAVYLRRDWPQAGGAELLAVTESHPFLPSRTRRQALAAVRSELPVRSAELLVDSQQDVPRYDRDEQAVWEDYAGRRWSPKRWLGEGLAAATAWQSVLAIAAVQEGSKSTLVNVVGTNQQAIGAAFGLARA